MRKASVCSALLLTAVCFICGAFISPAHASWSNDPAVNTVVSGAANNQEDQRITGDGSGGSIIVWTDYRNADPTYGDIYVQRMDANGVALWTADGVALTSAKRALNPRITSDGSGGAIVTWEHWNGSNYDIYAQKINAGGIVLWTTGGVTVSGTAIHTQRYPVLKTDGAGGAIIVWQDNRNGSTPTNYDIYAQRVDAADGHGLWTANGVPVCTASGDQTNPRIIIDDAGGAIIVWQDYRSTTNYDIYAQKINSSGVAQWATNGVVVSVASGDQYWQRLAKDGGGGAIITWEDYSSGTGLEIYARRLDATDGHALWTTPVCTTACSTGGTTIRRYPQVASDGNGGAIVVWQDYRLGTYYHIYAQRLDSNGHVLWTTDGLAISPLAQTHSQWYPDLVNDGHGRSIIAWFDTNGVYAQRIDLSGNKLWTADGVAVSALSTSTNTSDFWPALVQDSFGYGAIFAWTDYRNGSSNSDIYAQKGQSNGTLPCPDYPVRISETSTHYSTIQAAYNAANGQTVQMESIEFTENLLLNNGHAVKIRGGFRGCDFASATEFTTIHGTVTIGSGTVTAERLIIM